MPNPIAIFYHGLFYLGDKDYLLPNSVPIVTRQMLSLTDSGLLNECKFFLAGINGGVESIRLATMLLPPGASILFHGLQSRNECSTILALEQWLPGHEDWYVLYFHSKGATHTPADKWKATWGGCMFRNCVKEWRRCVADLDAGYESVGCHWMTGAKTPPGQSIWAGNFWWAKASFLRTLPSIMARDRIKQSGINSVDSRYESEVWLGNGPRLPKVKDYHGPDWDPSKAHTCVA